MFAARLVLLLLLSWLSPALLASVGLENVRMWHGPEKSRLVFDLSAAVTYNVYNLANPDRLVIDLDDAVFKGVLPGNKTVGQFLERVRKGSPRHGVLRIVLDLKYPVAHSVMVLKPNNLYGHRLVIDLASRNKAPTEVKTAPAGTAAAKPAMAAKRGPLVVVVDAGHGGEDPGALGSRKTFEKHVVLAIAKKLKERIDRQPNMVARLVRKGDYYVSLRERTRLARKLGADLFISIHADGFYKRSARGMSVYALSNKGATSETARWLANKENASDLVGGVSLHDKEDMLAKVLLDLSMTNIVNEGIVFARYVLQEMSKLGPVHSSKVEQAGFAVLKSPDIPSILIETGYITNPKEEALLRNPRYQWRMADAIFRGIEKFADKMGWLQAPGPKIHLVEAGDSLSMVAMRYGVSVSAIKRANGLNGNQINVGQRLKIPARDS